MNASARHLPADSLAFALLRAAEIIAAVIGGRTLDTALAACWLKYKPEPAQRGAIQDLCYGTLRAGPRGDFLLGRLLRSPLENVQIRSLLLAALYRLEQRPDDAHTTVDQAVNAAGMLAHGKFRALCNAVLRNALRRKGELEQDLSPAAQWRHPDWWIAAVRSAYPAEWEGVLSSANQHPPMTLRVNRRHADAAAYVACLAAAGIEARALDATAVLLEKPQAVDTLPGFAEGQVSVQDFGAQQAARFLDVAPGMRVLDACAAPGGKTAHLLESADVDLTALELDAKRIRRIHENLERLRLEARVVNADCANLQSWWDGRPFERILADVPCSAAGVVRRHPDIKWLRRPEDVGGFAHTQRAILDSLWQALAPGGKMLYCTCSIFPQENGDQVADFVSRHGDAERLNIEDRPELQLLPDAQQDGFYYALLQKRA